MFRDMKESDWRILRQLKPVALDRFCERALTQIGTASSNTARNHHEQFLYLFGLIRDQNKALADAFDDHRRSNALLKLATIKSYDLLTEEEFSRFSDETRAAIEVILSH